MPSDESEQKQHYVPAVCSSTENTSRPYDSPKIILSNAAAQSERPAVFGSDSARKRQGRAGSAASGVHSLFGLDDLRS